MTESYKCFCILDFFFVAPISIVEKTFHFWQFIIIDSRVNFVLVKNVGCLFTIRLCNSKFNLTIPVNAKRELVESVGKPISWLIYYTSAT